MAALERDTAIIDADALKAWLPSTGWSAGDTTLLGSIAQKASSKVSEHCRRKFTQSTYTDKLIDGPGGLDLHMPHWPIVSITSIYEDSAREFAAGSLLTEDTSSVSGHYRYYTDEESFGLVYRTSGSWLRARQCIKATFSAGYSSIPDDVITAALILGATWWQLVSNKMWAEQSRTVGVGDTSISIVERTALPTEVKSLLGPFRREGLW